MTYISEIKSKARIFKALATATGKNESVKFVVTYIDGVTDKGADILRYDENGKREIFLPPDKPDKPILQSTGYDNVQLSWSKPQDGAKSHTILYQQKDDPEDQWKVEKAEESILLENLKPETTYIVKTRAQYPIGICLDSDSSTFKTANKQKKSD